MKNRPPEPLARPASVWKLRAFVFVTLATAQIRVATPLGMLGPLSLRTARTWLRARDLAAAPRTLDTTLAQTLDLTATRAVTEHRAAVTNLDFARGTLDAADRTIAPACQLTLLATSTLARTVGAVCIECRTDRRDIE